MQQGRAKGRDVRLHREAMSRSLERTPVEARLAVIAEPRFTISGGAEAHTRL